MSEHDAQDQEQELVEQGEDRMDNMGHMNIPYRLLKEITNNFSEDRIIGHGTFGVVYKGVDKDGQEVAVKLLKCMQGVVSKELRREFNNLIKLKHQNIVQLVGFCNEDEEVNIIHDGEHIRAQYIRRALCFEYMPNGSLQKHLYDEHQGFDWQTRYNIIKGICEGLKYLHTGLGSPVYHLDLTPDNILLDNNMLPKISDFGLSRLLGEDTTMKTISALGKLGYLPPEYINNQIISSKFDIFSLGVIIIKIICGTAGYSLVDDMRQEEFVELVHNRWKERLRGTILGFTSLGKKCQEVKKCVEIALKCINKEKDRRPNIGYIVDQLDDIQNGEKDTPSRREEGLCCCQQSVLHLVLFLHQFVAGPNHPNRNEEFVIGTSNPHGFGTTLVDDYIITATSDPNGTIVARAQGLHMQAGQTVDNAWYTTFNMVFEDQKFAGSTLQVMGTTTEQNGEWSIVGGTGLFRRAKGTIEFINNIPESTKHDAIKQLHIEVFYTPKTS